MNHNTGKLEFRLLPKDDLYKEALAVSGRNDGTILLKITDSGLLILHP